MNSNNTLPMSLSPCFVYLISKEKCELYDMLCESFGMPNIWWNETNNNLQEKVRFGSYLKLPLSIIYDVYNNTIKIEMKYYNDTKIYHNVQDCMNDLHDIYRKSNYINLTMFKPSF